MARTVVATDNFNRLDLGANWAHLTDADINQIRIASSTHITASAEGGDGAEGAARWDGAGTFANDQYSSMKARGFSAAGGLARIGVIARASADVNTARDYYFYEIQDTDPKTTVLGKVVNGTRTALASSTTVTWTDEDRVEIECEGTTIRGLKNGVQQQSATDSALTTGKPGVYATTNDGMRGDDWEGGDLTAAAVTKGRVLTAPYIPA